MVHLFKSRRGRLVAMLVALMLVFVGAGVFRLHAHQMSADVAPPVARSVMELSRADITTLAPQTLTQSIKITGSITPVRTADISSRIAGALASVSVKVGDAVKAGDIVARLDTSDLEIRLRQQIATRDASVAQLDYARFELEQTRTSVEKSILARNKLDKAETDVEALAANVDALDAQVDSARKALEDATIRAPFDGIVSARFVNEGLGINAGTRLFTVVDISTMELEASVPLGSIPRIKQGDTAEVAVDGIEKPLAATVSRTSPVAVEGSRSAMVYLSMTGPDGLLRGGMFASGEIVLDQHADAIAVPDSALRRDGSGVHVLKLAGGEIVAQPVQTGSDWNGGALVEITSGLNAGDTIITTPLDLVAGTPVSVEGAGS